MLIRQTRPSYCVRYYLLVSISLAAVNVKMRHNKYYQLLGHLRTGAARFLVVGPLAHAVAAVGISESQLVHVHLGDSVGFSQ